MYNEKEAKAISVMCGKALSRISSEEASLNPELMKRRYEIAEIWVHALSGNGVPVRDKNGKTIGFEKVTKRDIYNVTRPLIPSKPVVPRKCDL
jgi:hypothetical protein